MSEEKLLKSRKKELEVYLKYDQFEEDFKGPVDQVLRALLAFLDKVYPGLEILSHVLLTVDLQELIEEIKDIVAITPSGPVVLYKMRLTVKELIGLNLIGAYLGYKLNLAEKPSLSLDELVTLTRKIKGSVSGALTPLVNGRLVEKPEKGEYKISLLGIKHFIDEVFPRLRRETN